MGKKLNMVAQTSKDLQKMCKELDLKMHLVISDDKDMISAGCGELDKLVHLLGDSLIDIAKESGEPVVNVLSHLIVYVNGVPEDE